MDMHENFDETHALFLDMDHLPIEKLHLLKKTNRNSREYNTANLRADSFMRVLGRALDLPPSQRI